MQTDADDDGRHEGRKDGKNETPSALIGRQSQCDLPQFGEVDRQDGKDGTELNQHFEDLARRVETEKVPGQQDVAG